MPGIKPLINLGTKHCRMYFCVLSCN